MCTTGYYRIQLECQPCPVVDWKTVGIAAGSVLLFFLCFLGIAVRLQVFQKLKEVQTKFPIDMGLVGMGITLVQTIASYKQLDLKWTPMLKTTVGGISASNVNVDLVSPECASSTLRFVCIYVCECDNHHFVYRNL